jgi:hypothetical protein
MEESMSKSTISTDYMNTLLFENQKAFWDERGKGALFRLTTVGRAFFNDKILPQLNDSSTLETVINTIDRVLQEEGIIEQGEMQIEDKLVRIKLKSCVHRGIAARFSELGLPPCYCLPANLCVLAIDTVLDLDAEIAEIKVEDDHCEALIVIFERYQRQL